MARPSRYPPELRERAVRMVMEYPGLRNLRGGSETPGFGLPDSCRNYEAHWYGYDGSAVARAIADAGWKATHVNLTAPTVTFVRVTGA